MKNIFIFIVIALFPFSLFANIETTYVQIDGIGKTKAEAIKNALIEIVKQTNGVKISSQKAYTKAISELGISKDGEKFHNVSIAEKSQKLISEATQGFIRSYSVLEAKEEANQWYVNLGVKIKKYISPGLNPHKRRKIAIIPFEYKKSYDILNSYEAGREVSKRFTQSLVSKITQARKFTVLDRENSKYYQQEKNFLLSGNSNQDELLKLGKRLGTDYLLIGQILELSIQNITTTNNIGLPSTSRLVCNATISYRIMMMATQQVKWSETISKEFYLDDSINQISQEALLANASEEISTIISNNILNNIYPPLITSVTKNSILVNQGGNSIKKGSIFIAYTKGKKLTDPYTKEFLGYEEIKAGEIEIINVTPKVSYAKLLNGTVAQGMILRANQEKNSSDDTQGKAKTDVKIKQNGGISLPFD